MPDSSQDKIADLMQRLGISKQDLQNVRLGPGIVGRNSTIAWVLEIVMLAGVIGGTVEHSPTLIGISLVGAVVVALVIPLANIHFGNKNPAAAILEGAEFVQYQQIQMTLAKGGHPVELSGPVVSNPLPAQTHGSNEHSSGTPEGIR